MSQSFDPQRTQPPNPEAGSSMFGFLSDPSRRGTWLGAVLLLLGTLGIVHAARLAASPADPALSTDLTRRATAHALTFAGRLDRGAIHVGSSGEVHLELTARGSDFPERAIPRRPTDVVVVLDRSGSMEGDPLTKALAAIRELISS